MPPPQAPGNGTLILEEPLIRVSSLLLLLFASDDQTPYELLRRSHRAAQRQVEKDFLGVQVSCTVSLFWQDADLRAFSMGCSNRLEAK